MTQHLWEERRAKMARREKRMELLGEVIGAALWFFICWASVVLAADAILPK